MALSIDRIVQLFEMRGAERHGAEPVSPMEHALQCATLAAAAGESAELITASLLHDLGHLLYGHGENYLDDGVDDSHQYVVLRHLQGLFPDPVLQPIRLHVDAKRYLCAMEPGYRDTLSPASKRSLELQGGVLTRDEADYFIALPYARDAVQLRRWDDLAKVPGRPTPPLFYFAGWMRACSLLEPMTAEKFHIVL